MLERVLGIRRAAAPKNQLSGYQLSQSKIKLRLWHRYYGADEFVGELTHS
jgi:hypothetical protein